MRTSNLALASTATSPSKFSRASLAQWQATSTPQQYPAQPIEPVVHAGKQVRRRTAAEHAVKALLRTRRHTGPVGTTTAHAADGRVLLRAV
jgi:hypothetical protein